MKKAIMTLVLIQSTLSWAGSFKADDFNQMIQESQKAEVELRQNLQKEAGIKLDDKPGTLAKEKYMAPREAEQVVVDSSQSIWAEKKDQRSKAQQKADMRRLSQELQESSN